MKPTEQSTQQKAVVDAVLRSVFDESYNQRHVVVEAVAGAGKTSPRLLLTPGEGRGGGWAGLGWATTVCTWEVLQFHL